MVLALLYIYWLQLLRISPTRRLGFEFRVINNNFYYMLLKANKAVFLRLNCGEDLKVQDFFALFFKTNQTLFVELSKRFIWTILWWTMFGFQSDQLLDRDVENTLSLTERFVSHCKLRLDYFRFSIRPKTLNKFRV